jgi:hypothetical protein
VKARDYVAKDLSGCDREARREKPVFRRELRGAGRDDFGFSVG